MSLYKQWFITTMLRYALQGGANSTSKVTFKRMVASNDLISEKDFPGLTNESMQTIKTNQSALISSTTTKGNVVTITSVFNSFNVTQEYKMNTIYLVAEYNGRDFLAAITSANDPYTMPVESKTEHAEYTIKAQLGLSNSSTVDLNMDPEAVATNEQLSAVDDKHTNAFDKLKGMIDSLFEIDKDNVKTEGSQTIGGTKTYLQKIVGSVSGSAAKLEIGRKINGILFDGTKDITIEAKPNNDSDIVHKSGNEDVSGMKNFLGGLIGNLKGNADTATNAKNADVAKKATLADDATKLKTPRKVNGVDFDGTKNINVNAANDSNIVHKDGAETVSGVKTFTQKIIASISGTADTAIRLLTPRKINNVPFDGTKDISVKASNDDDLVHKSGAESASGMKTFMDRMRTRSGLAISNSMPKGEKNNNVYPLFLGVPNVIADGVDMVYASPFVLNPNIKGQTNNNVYMGIQSGGTMAIGSGESAASMATAMADNKVPVAVSPEASTEQLLLVSDQHVHIGAGYQNGGDTGQWLSFYSTGNVKVPGYITASSFKGNADTATTAKNADSAKSADAAERATLADDATKLKTPRKVNGVEFDGTKDITVTATPNWDKIATFTATSPEFSETKSGAIYQAGNMYFYDFRGATYEVKNSMKAGVFYDLNIKITGIDPKLSPWIPGIGSTNHKSAIIETTLISTTQLRIKVVGGDLSNSSYVRPGNIMFFR